MHIFTDGSTASRVEKARRVLRKLTEPSAYFHDDGYPRHDRIKNDAAAALEVLDGMHGLLLLALYHHQGGSSPVGQPIRRALGIGEHDHMTPEQIELAKGAGSLPFNAIYTARPAV